MTRYMLALLAFTLGIGVSGADLDGPAPLVRLSDDPATAPKIVEASPVAKSVTIEFGAPLKLSQDRFRWFKVLNATGPITWEVEPEGVIGLQEFTKAGQLFGTVEGADQPTFSDIADGSVVVWRKTDGLVKLTAYGVVGGRAKKLDRITILCGPQPPPKPVDPVDPPKPPSPLPSDKLRVMMIYESENKLTADQSSAMRATEIKNSIKAAGGEWRCWDKDVAYNMEAEFWKKAMDRGKDKTLPWVIISSPMGFTEGPITNLANLKADLRKHGVQ